MLEGLCERLGGLELALGDVDSLRDGGLCELLVSLTRELQRVLKEGHDYSEQFLQLLETFGRGDHKRRDDDLERLHAVLSRYDEILRTLKALTKLDVVYQAIARPEAAVSTPVVEIRGLEQLPLLIDTCNRQLVWSLSLVQRFLAWNIANNELFSGIDARLKTLDNDN